MTSSISNNNYGRPPPPWGPPGGVGGGSDRPPIGQVTSDEWTQKGVEGHLDKIANDTTLDEGYREKAKELKQMLLNMQNDGLTTAEMEEINGLLEGFNGELASMGQSSSSSTGWNDY